MIIKRVNLFLKEFNAFSRFSVNNLNTFSYSFARGVCSPTAWNCSIFGLLLTSAFCFHIAISLQPDSVHLRNVKLRNFDLKNSQFKISNVFTLQHRVAKIKEIKILQFAIMSITTLFFSVISNFILHFTQNNFQFQTNKFGIWRNIMCNYWYDYATSYSSPIFKFTSEKRYALGCILVIQKFSKSF